MKLKIPADLMDQLIVLGHHHHFFDLIQKTVTNLRNPPLAHGARSGFPLDAEPKFIKGIKVIGVDCAHEEPAIGLGDQQPRAFQQAPGLTHRRATDAKIACDYRFRDAVARLELSGHDGIRQDPRNPLGQSIAGERFEKWLGIHRHACTVAAELSPVDNFP
nr:hypothetical protein [Roseovarius halotolerans]